MNKKLNTLIITLLSVTYAAIAQQTTESPYSFYGVGERNFGGLTEESAMGGVGVFADSTRVNIQNPAALASLKYTSFSAGLTMQSKKIVTSTQKLNVGASAFDYVVLGFPIAKNLGIGVGLLPYSSVGYIIKSTVGSNNYQYEGRGNVNQFFGSVAYKVYDGLQVGVSMKYHFGNIAMKDVIQQHNVEFYTQEESKSVLSGAVFNLGLYYQHTLQQRLRLYGSLVYTPESKLSSENERTISLLSYINNGKQGTQLAVRNGSTVDLAAKGLKNTKLTLPAQTEIGLGIGAHQQWFAGVAYTFTANSKFSNPFLSTTNVGYENSYKLSVGGFWIPNYNSFSSYWHKVTYRVGFRYDSMGIVLNGERLNDFGTSFGLTLLVKGFSNLTGMIELGRKGTLSTGVLKENYINLKIGFTLNDKWFQRTKYQ